MKRQVVGTRPYVSSRKCSVCVGDKFNRLTVIELYIVDYGDDKSKTMAKCQCDCGKIVDVGLQSIKTNRTKSCGCFNREAASLRMAGKNNIKYKHGMGYECRLYRIWGGMKTRCNNPRYFQYKDYGGRGIKICDEWNDDFKSFYDWAINNGYEDKLTIDRIDVNGNYEPLNCRWVTNSVQSENKRVSTMPQISISAFGDTKTLKEWLIDDRCVVKKSILMRRLYLGWTAEDALSKPVRT